MKGFIKLPLYKDQACTQYYKDLRVPVIDKEHAQVLGQQKIPIVNEHTGETLYVNGPGLYNDGVSFGVGDKLLWGQVPGYRNITQSALAAWNSALALRMTSILNAASTNQDSIDDNFNIIKLFDETRTYYLKNGSSIKVTLSTETIAGSDSTPVVRMEFNNPSGNKVLDLAYNAGMPSPVILGPRGDQFTSGIPIYGAFAAAANYCETYQRNCGSSCYIIPFYLLDDDTLVYDQYGYFYSATLHIYSAGTGAYWYKSSGGSFPQGNLYRFLGATSTKNKVSQIIEDAEFVEDNEDVDNTYPGGGDDKNTYPPDGESGKGTFDNTNDPVDFPSMPLWDATSTGFISMWNPTIAEITQLYSFLWDSDISTTLKKLFLEPMDAIISLAFFPVDPVNFPEKRNVTIGHVDTEITMYAVQKQFVDFDFGTIKLDEYYGAAWDYSPYTKVSIYLPYIGSAELDVDDVMNANLHLQYRIDLLSGMCVAMLKCTRDRDDLDAIIYNWQGNCSMQVPITAGSAREFINTMIQLSAMAGLALAQPAAGAINAAAGGKDYNPKKDPVWGGNWVSPTMATYAALNVLGQKVHVQRGGRVDANSGVMSPQSAYLIIDRPVSAIPKGWNEYAGYPSLKIKALSTQKGMTQVAYIKLNGLEATAEEISELDSILRAGVIL